MRVRILVSIALMLVTADVAGAQRGIDLFQQALAKERAEGQLDEAIQIYRRIVRDFPKDRALVAKTLVQLGRAYEKLGRDEARQAYSRVVREFADQRDAAAEARARLSTVGAAGVADAPRARLVSSDALGGAIVGMPSADGRVVSYTDASTGNLALYDVAAKSGRTLTTYPAAYGWTEYAETHVPSPDGSRIAYAWYTKSGGYELRLIAARGTATPRTLVGAGSLAWLVPFGWTSDGRNILTLFNTQLGEHVLSLVDAATGARRDLVKTPGEPARAAVSPDGRWIVYDAPDSVGSQQHDLFIVPSSGGAPRRIVDHPAIDVFPAWTADGKGVVFRSDRTGGPAMWLVAVANGAAVSPPRIVKPGMGSMLPLGLTRDSTLYYLSETMQRNVYVAELDVAAGRIVQPPAIVTQRYVGTNSDPDWSPDGRSLAFVSSRIPYVSVAPARVLCILSLDSGRQRDIVLPLLNWHRPRWSPDGQSIFVWGIDTNRRSGVYRVDPATGATRAIVEEPLGTSVVGFELSRDGKSLYVVAVNNGANGRHLTLHSIESGDAKELYRLPSSGTLSHPATSPDGKWIAFVTTDSGMVSLANAELRVMPAAGGAMRTIRRGRTAWARGLNWTSDSREILFMVPGDKELQLWAVDVVSGTSRRLELTIPSSNNMRLAPDGRHIAYGAGEGTDQLWVLERFLAPQKR